MSDLRAALESLDAKVTAAERKAKEARLKARSPEDAGRDLLASLTDYHRGITYRKRSPDRAAEARLVSELLAEVQRDGVSLVPVDPTVAAKGVRVLDRRDQLEVTRVQNAAHEVRQERDKFAAEHAAELHAETDAEEFARIREAWESGDASRLRSEVTNEHVCRDRP